MNWVAVYHFNGFDVNIYGSWPTSQEAAVFIEAFQEWDRVTNYDSCSLEDYRETYEGDGFWEVRELKKELA